MDFIWKYFASQRINLRFLTGGFSMDLVGPTELLKLYEEGWSMCLSQEKVQIFHSILKGVWDQGLRISWMVMTISSLEKILIPGSFKLSCKTKQDLKKKKINKIVLRNQDSLTDGGGSCWNHQSYHLIFIQRRKPQAWLLKSPRSPPRVTAVFSHSSGRSLFYFQPTTLFCFCTRTGGSDLNIQEHVSWNLLEHRVLIWESEGLDFNPAVRPRHLMFLDPLPPSEKWWSWIER